MIKLKKILMFTLAGVFLSSSSCIYVNKKETVEDEKNSLAQPGITGKVQDSVFYLLPTPGEILDRIQNSGINYNSSIVNPAKNSNKYLDSRAKSMNLGIYISDMAYCALSGRSTETITFLETIKTLSDEVGISSSVFESLIERAKINTGNIDSLVNISNMAFSNMLEFLETGGRENTLALIAAGAYVESLYLALESVTEYSVDNPIFKLISDMKYPLDNLFERIKSLPQDEKTQSIVNFLNQIILIFNDMEMESSKMIISKNPQGDILVFGGGKLNLNLKSFISLKARTKEIRTSIINF